MGLSVWRIFLYINIVPTSLATRKMGAQSVKDLGLILSKMTEKDAMASENMHGLALLQSQRNGICLLLQWESLTAVNFRPDYSYY